MSVFLHGLSTALPPHTLRQDKVQERAAIIFGDKYPQFSRLSKTFASAEIDKRHSVVPLDWFSNPHGWKDRNEIYMVEAKKLFINAAQSALVNAGWKAEDVDTVVTVSSTGIATPTLEAQAFTEMGFRDSIMRVPLFGLGCAGGVSGLSVAQSLATAKPQTKVLLVIVETCSLAFRADRLQKADIIASVLFGDGAAAACISTCDPQSREISLGGGYQKIWPDTLGIMGWDLDDTGFGVVFDRSIPSFVSKHFAPAMQDALKATDLTHADIDRYVCHPGGTKVVEAIEVALDLSQRTLDAERDVLRKAGNMSAPTVLFVLEDVLKSGASGQMMACALGPGFTASFLPLHVAEGVN
jgi:alkylresorcinol/alkylpyrone synthase